MSIELFYDKCNAIVSSVDNFLIALISLTQPTLVLPCKSVATVGVLALGGMMWLRMPMLLPLLFLL